MIGLVSLLLCAVASILLVPVLVFALQVLSASLSRRIGHGAAAPGLTRPRVAVLVPAHNEEGGILQTLQTLRAQLRADDRLLVVADNCSDATADVARAAGAEVIERQHASLRGKGYALDFGVRYLGQNAPDIVVIVDADCQLAPGSIERLAGQCARTGRATQALYLMQAGPGAGLKQRIAEFAWQVKNLVRPLGFSVLGLPCQLMGTGMAFRWADISSVSLASGHLVEDMKLGVDLALKGRAPLFCAEALVTSRFPDNASGVVSQRTRWEHGHLSVIIREVPAMLWSGFGSRNLALIAMALDLLVPPLALLCMLNAALVLLAAGFLVIWGSVMPLLASGLALCLLGLAVMLAWLRFGRTIVSLSDLCLAVVYACWKIPMYLKFIWGRQTEWVRTRRDE